MDATADPVSPVDVVDPAPLPWDAVWGQPDAVEILRAAAADPTAMTHAWLITGPPGSGRSTLAYAFAAALIAEPGDETVMRQVLARTHPDLTALRTEQVIIRIDEARKLVERAFYAPSLGRHRQSSDARCCAWSCGPTTRRGPATGRRRINVSAAAVSRPR